MGYLSIFNSNKIISNISANGALLYMVMYVRETARRWDLYLYSYCDSCRQKMQELYVRFSHFYPSFIRRSDPVKCNTGRQNFAFRGCGAGGFVE